MPYVDTKLIQTTIVYTLGAFCPESLYKYDPSGANITRRVIICPTN